MIVKGASIQPLRQSSAYGDRLKEATTAVSTYAKGIKACKVSAQTRFLAKSAEKSLPFFKTLKKYTKKSDFLWTEEAETAFKQMKEHIAKLPMLTAPEEQEELIVYLAASKEAVSAVLLTEREAKQMPIYFVSRALRGPEVNYTAMEKLVLALVHASKRLRRYFQAHPITVITDQPIKNILSNPEVAGRMQKWSIQLGEFGIHYRPIVSVKGQVLADFIVERTGEEGQDDSAKEEEPLPTRWTMFTDGSSCVDGCGAGVILTDPKGVEFTYALRFQFEATNNEAEYEALIAGLLIAEKIGVQNLEVNVDSKLVANQLNGTYIAKETDMIKYLEKVKVPVKHKWAIALLTDFTINVIVIGAWFFYKESSWIKTLIFIVLMFAVGSLATCGYILIQFHKLSPEEFSEDPLYFVLVRHQNRDVAQQTHGPSVVTARVIFSGLGCLMLGVLIYTIVIDLSPSHDKSFAPCLPTYLTDIYIHAVVLSVWIAYKEASWISAFLWILSLLCLGKFGPLNFDVCNLVGSPIDSIEETIDCRSFSVDVE
ncbi:reverse transcriptase domain-containing protein [Tanacetum coccineum]